MAFPQTLRYPYFRRALGWCIPIGGMGGLIGLGGGGFRLPALNLVPTAGVVDRFCSMEARKPPLKYGPYARCAIFLS